MDAGNIGFILLLDAIEEVEALEEEVIPREPRRFFQRNDAFTLGDIQFIKMFRLTKEMVRNLIELVTPFIIPSSRKSALDIQTKVLVALKFYAGGSYQMDVGSNINLAVSQPSVSRCVKEVTTTLNNPQIMDQWVKFPNTIEDLQSIRREFHWQYGFPGVVGCIDCSHIAIVPPTRDEHVFVNRKQYHSLNVQLICDHTLRILNVNSRFPGSSHDSYIWRQSNVRIALEDLYRRTRNTFYLLGDSGYPLRPWLMTPIENDPAPDTPEGRYNQQHKCVRSIIERCIGLLKQRFRCLLKDRVLHYSPETVALIVNACVVLHNMCIVNNAPMPDEEIPDVEEVPNEVNVEDEEINAAVGRINPDLAEGRRIRAQIINNFR